jgi:hypothetical protein
LRSTTALSRFANAAGTEDREGRAWLTQEASWSRCAQVRHGLHPPHDANDTTPPAAVAVGIAALGSVVAAQAGSV